MSARHGLRRWVGAYCSAGAHGNCQAVARCDCPCHQCETVGVVVAPEPERPKSVRQSRSRGGYRVVNPVAYSPRRLDRKFTNETVPCPKCLAPAGEPCREPDGRETAVSHGARCSAARPGVRDAS